MSRFLEALHSGRVLLMDGAMGTELRNAGLGDTECGELWNLTHPERVRAIHQAYADAGAQCLLTNTFQANRKSLERWQLHQRWEEITQQAISLALAVAGSELFVLVDIGPISPAPTADDVGDPKALEHVIPELRGVDALLLETYSDPLALFTARHCRVVSWSETVPILLSLTYERSANGDLCTHSRHPPEWFAMQAKQYGIAALGVNCGRDLGMDDLIAIVRRYRRVTDLPLFARPNAGTPTRAGERWTYPLSSKEMAARLPELLEAGISMIGGCCGTTPEHIAAFRPIVQEWNARKARFGSA